MNRLKNQVKICDMDDDLFIELFGEDNPEKFFLSDDEITKYLLPINFKQGNILYSFNDNQLNIEVFYNHLKNKKNMDN